MVGNGDALDVVETIQSCQYMERLRSAIRQSSTDSLVFGQIVTCYIICKNLDKYLLFRICLSYTFELFFCNFVNSDKCL